MRIFIYFIGLAVIVGIWFLIKKPYFTDYGIAEGKVLGSKQIQGLNNQLLQDRPDEAAIISYVVNGKAFTIFGPENVKFDKDEKIEVRYIKDNPNKAAINSVLGLVLDKFILVPFGLLILWSALIFNNVFMKKR